MNTKILPKIFGSHLRNGLPRRVSYKDELPMHVFTDGTLKGCEGEKAAGLRAVLVDSQGNCLSAFGLIPTLQVDEAGWESTSWRLLL